MISNQTEDRLITLKRHTRMDKRALRTLNEVGKRYGRWVVVSRGKDYISQGQRLRRTTFWNCVCDCGVTKAVKGSSLRTGQRTSCGWFRMDNLKLPGDQAAINSRINSIVQSARRRNIKYALT